MQGASQSESCFLGRRSAAAGGDQVHSGLVLRGRGRGGVLRRLQRRHVADQRHAGLVAARVHGIHTVHRDTLAEHQRDNRACCFKLGLATSFFVWCVGDLKLMYAVLVAFGGSTLHTLEDFSEISLSNLHQANDCAFLRE